MLAGYVPLASGEVVLEHDSEAIAVPHGRVFVGRSEGCFQRLADPAVSRVHLCLDIGDEALVEDLGSRNGTLLNGQVLRGRRRLRSGDVIQVGARAFTVRVLERATDPSAEEETSVGAPGGTLLGVSAVSPGAQTQLTPVCPACNALDIADGRCGSCGLEIPNGASARKETMRGALEADVGRRHPRFSVDLPVRYRGAELDFSAQATNLSRTGLFISCHELDDLGASCELRLCDNAALRAFGVVRHLLLGGRGRRTGMGIEFTAMNDDCRSWLEAELAERGHLASPLEP